MSRPVETTTKEVQGTSSVASTSRNEAIERLQEYFNLSISPEQTAKILRQAVFTISEFQIMQQDEPSTYDGSVYSVIFYLNDLAETLDPYFTKES
jgi:hypothetical protein